MISLFAFLLTLGIVVDDAIIVGESVHSAQSRGLSGVHGALVGTRQVVNQWCSPSSARWCSSPPCSSCPVSGGLHQKESPL